MTAETKNEITEEIEISEFEQMMNELVESNELEKEGFSVFIYGQGSQTTSFYEELKNNPDIELIWTDWAGDSWWSYIFRFIPGEMGLLRIKNIKKTKELYKEVGILSYCGLYFIPKDKEQSLIDNITNKQNDFRTNGLFDSQSEYFLLDIDFDYNGGKRDGEIFFKVLQFGDGLSNNLKQILRINK